MNKTIYRRYAKLTVKVGAGVKKGQDVVIHCSLEAAPFARYVLEEAYKAGARSVRMDWHDDQSTITHYKYASVDVLSYVPKWIKERYLEENETYPCNIHIIDADPDMLKDIDMSKYSEVKIRQYKEIKELKEASNNKIQWTIVAVPSVAWAKKVFPELSSKAAVKKLWESIIKCTRVDAADPIKAWKEHIANMKKKADTMNDYQFDVLHFTSGNGTDFKVRLHPLHQWISAEEKTLLNKSFVANIPTEEVFTMPYKYGADGVVVSTKPLSYEGNLIEDFKVYFENGKAYKVSAKVGEEHLSRMINTDDGACYLGEVALVPYTSPINQVGHLFYNTLFDENASCHLALGRAYHENLKGYEKMTEDDFEKAEYNTSVNHVDFMVGSKDLSIVGTTKDGKEVVVFKDGVWAI